MATIVSKIRNFNGLAIFSTCTGCLVSDLVENSEDMFLRDTAHYLSSWIIYRRQNSVACQFINCAVMRNEGNRTKDNFG